MIKEVNGFEAMKNIKQTYMDFLRDEDSVVLTVLGTPRNGKRYWLKKVLKEMQIDDFVWLSGIAGKSLEEYYYKQLCQNPDKIIVFYELTSTGFTNDKEKSFFLNLSQSRIVNNPGIPSKNGLPEQLHYKGKAFIIDDPYSKRDKRIREVLNGIAFEMSLSDIIGYLEYSSDSILDEHKLSEAGFNSVLSMLNLVASKKENPDACFSVTNISDITRAIKQLDEEPEMKTQTLKLFGFQLMQSK